MHDDGYFDHSAAARYDELTADMFAPEVLGPTVDFLADLAGDGPALEFGVGTGRVALSLAGRGIPVHGVDISRAMVRQLRAKGGEEAVEVTIGDFSSTRIDGHFTLVYLVFNTITNLLTSDDQVACFRNAAAHLEPGGCFVIEVDVPDLRLLPPGVTTRVFHASENRWGIDEFDLVNQRLVSHHFVEGEDGLERFSTPHRWVWPSELDLMARLAGMTLRERWSGWDRHPFTHESSAHVSVWQVPGDR